jgi:hypothetical protein
MAVEIKSTLEGTQKEIQQGKAYLVDFNKMKSVNDLVLIISALGITFPAEHPLIENLKPFLNLDNPIDLQPQPKKAEFIPLDKEDLQNRIFNKEK